MTPPTPDRASIIVITGGPGGPLKKWLADPILKELKEEYNVLLYDQRGVGRYSSIDEFDTPGYDARTYSSAYNVEDIELLRKELIDKGLGQDKVNIYGHSYGAHLAWTYGAKYQGNVQNLFVLNGTSDFSAGVIQTIGKQLFILTLIARLFSGGEQPDTPLSQDTAFPFPDAADNIPGTFDSSPLPAFTALQNLTASQTKRLRMNFNHSVEIAHVVNSIISCHEFTSPKAFEYFKSENAFNFTDEQLDVLQEQFFINHDAICPDIYDEAYDFPFRVTEDIASIAVPTLIAAASSDPLVNIMTIRRDYQWIREHQQKVAFVELKNALHDPLHQKDCFLPKVQKMLESGNVESSFFTAHVCL